MKKRLRGQFRSVRPYHDRIIENTALVLYGQMAIDTPQNKRNALERHEAAVRQTGIDFGVGRTVEGFVDAFEVV